MPPRRNTPADVAAALREKPIVAVVRTNDFAAAGRRAQTFVAAELGLVEITFSVPDAPRLVEKLRRESSPESTTIFGMGTVTTAERARAAVDAGAQFLVSPNVSPEVAEIARDNGLFLILGALTPTEIVTARSSGADLVKVYPLPPVGGPRYLATVREPLADIPMLAAGGFTVEEIPAYRAAGASAFGMGPTLLGGDEQETRRLIARALELARAKTPP
jgi:2-dehydro-3-deoxyphosphogluconate aldolase/(4S)-4-hydroxy-2-oxoglutarate aldolase